jgi:hypothetical protein
MSAIHRQKERSRPRESSRRGPATDQKPWIVKHQPASLKMTTGKFPADFANGRQISLQSMAHFDHNTGNEFQSARCALGVRIHPTKPIDLGEQP